MTNPIADAAARLYALRAEQMPLNQTLVAAIVTMQEQLLPIYRDAKVSPPARLIDLDEIDNDRSTDREIHWSYVDGHAQSVHGSVDIAELNDPELAAARTLDRIAVLVELKAMEKAEKEIQRRRNELATLETARTRQRQADGAVLAGGAIAGAHERKLTERRQLSIE